MEPINDIHSKAAVSNISEFFILLTLNIERYSKAVNGDAEAA